jgi:MacB-like periplasmic core domain
MPLWRQLSRGLRALISESLARRRFPAESPIGQRLRIGPADGPPYNVVGVVGDLKQLSLAASDSDAVAGGRRNIRRARHQRRRAHA